MRRRTFVATAAAATCGVCAGCLGATSGGDPPPVLASLELENHRRERGYEFSVTVEGDAGVAFRRTTRLGPAGSGEGATAFERPVADPGAYTVRVAAGGDVVTVETDRLADDGEPCLLVRFYLGARELRVEWRSYRECD